MKKIILTGDRPTGKLHLGHYVGSLENRVKMQQEAETESFIMIADQQGLTDHAHEPELIQKNVVEVALDYLAVGIDPVKSHIFIQSQVPELAELTMYYLNLVTLARLQRNPTVKTEMKEKNFEQSLPTGFLIYPVSQAADITAFQATHVPVGEDQLPMLEQAKEIVRDFNRIYQTNVLIEPEIILPAQGQGRLIGIDGKGKMSKSLNNGIYLSDSEAEVKQKIMNMYTDPAHIHISDPGRIEGNVVFTYLDVFAPDQAKVTELKMRYQKGGLGDVAIKTYLNEVLQTFLAPIRKRRADFAQDTSSVLALLKAGSLVAEKKAARTLDQVKRAMGIHYF